MLDSPKFSQGGSRHFILAARLAQFVALVFAGGRALAAGAAPEGPAIGPVPVDFILFALTLLGVALFHHHTFRVAVYGLAVITLYKLKFTAFKTGAGLGGLALSLGREWVTLANLFCQLMGFKLLSRHFEESQVPAVLPRFLPDDRKGGVILLWLVPMPWRSPHET